LAGRAKGMDQVDSARIGSELASLVIQHRGAIVPAILSRRIANLLPAG